MPSGWLDESHVCVMPPADFGPETGVMKQQIEYF
jgi:hypothetical protein